MGLFRNAKAIQRIANLDFPEVPVVPSHHSRVRLPASPWATGSLTPLVWYDIFGAYSETLTRAQALTIPGVARGVGILRSLIADKPLVNYAGGLAKPSRGIHSTRVEDQPSWLFRSPGWQGPYRRMMETLDDHIFCEASLWGCRRGAAGGNGGLRPILEAWHIAYDSWRVNDGGVIEVIDPETGEFAAADEDEVIYLPGPSDGLLSMATRTLRGSVDLEDAWIRRAKNPIPMVDLHETQETNLDDTERQEVVDAFAAGRADPNGAIASTPWNIDARVLGQYSADMFIGARNAARLDLANFFQIPASVMDASTATASLTYVTTEGDANSMDTMTVPYWVRPIEDRLSQDDIVPAGHIVRFSFAEAYTEPQGRIEIQAPSAIVRDAAVDNTAEAVEEAVAATAPSIEGETA